MFTFRHLRQREIDHVMVGVDDQQQGGIGARPADARDLGAAIHEHAQAATMAVLPLFGGHFAGIGRQPGDVLDADVFVEITDQKAPAP
ncbi:hypothetical protein D3C76_1487650 [compost metagenome]